MNILYVDMTSMNVEEVASLHEQLSYKAKWRFNYTTDEYQTAL